MEPLRILQVRLATPPDRLPQTRELGRGQVQARILVIKDRIPRIQRMGILVLVPIPAAPTIHRGLALLIRIPAQLIRLGAGRVLAQKALVRVIPQRLIPRGSLLAVVQPPVAHLRVRLLRRAVRARLLLRNSRGFGGWCHGSGTVVACCRVAENVNLGVTYQRLLGVDN